MTNPSPRKLLQHTAGLAIRYRESLGRAGQGPQCDYRDLLAAFDVPMPEEGCEGREAIDTLVSLSEPGLNTMCGSRFFGWVIGGSHPVGVAADWLTGAWGQNAGNHEAAPAASAAETVAARWILDVLDLPRASSVGFVTGATIANFVGLAAARGEVLRRVGWDVEANGLFGAPPISVVIGDDAHATVFSALKFLGLGHDRVIRVGTDRQGRMAPTAAAVAIGRLDGPAIVILQAGQINTGGFDDFAPLIAAAHEAGAWVHIDGAFGLWARASPRHAELAAGAEDADSWATDGHKWLQTPYDCGYAIVRHEEAHRRAMAITASYLPAAEEGERNPSHYVPELSRRARGFATWAMLKHLGRHGIADMVDRHCRAARLIADRLQTEDGVAVLNDVVLNQVIVRFGADGSDDVADRLTTATIDRIRQDAVLFAGGAVWRGRNVMRISVISWETTETEALLAAEAIVSAWQAVREQARIA